MLRSILFLSLFAVATGVTAQTGNTPAKNTKNIPEAQIDYEQPGAPMPPLRYVIYHDTSTKNKMALAAVLKNDSADNAGKSSKKKKKKHMDDVMAEGAKPVLTNEDIDNGANVFIMMFNPNCSHCQDETVMLEKGKALFDKTKIVLLAAPNMKAYLSDFITFTHVDQYSSFMYLGIDSSDFTKKAFLYKALPQINIYNKKQKLIKAYSGEIALDSLKQYIQ